MGGRVAPPPPQLCPENSLSPATLSLTRCVALDRLPHLSLVTRAYLEETGALRQNCKGSSGLNPNKLRTAKLFATLWDFLPLGHVLNLIHLQLS